MALVTPIKRSLGKWKMFASGDIIPYSFFGTGGLNAGNLVLLDNNTYGTVPDAGLTLSYLKADGSRPLTGNWTVGAFNFISDTVTGIKIATATNQKLGFFNSTPIVQPTGSIITALNNLGLVGSATFNGSELTLSDVTTNDVSITRHGFAPKAPNDATKYLDGTGAYSVPAGGTTYTFSTGLTNAAGTITNNLSVGISGGQTAIGGTAVGDALTLKGTTGNGTSSVASIVGSVGNNGATNAFNIYNDGQFLIGGSTRNPGALGLVRIEQGGGTSTTVDIGKLGSGTSAIWLNMSTPSTTNYALSGGANTTNVNAGTTMNFNVANVAKITATSGTLVFATSIINTGASVPFTFTAPASTNQTLSTEINGFVYSLTTSRQWAAGALSLQREFYIQTPTYRFVGASTVSDAFSFYVDAGPIASTNTTITRSWSAGFNGRVGIATNLYIGGLATAATASLHLAAGTATASTAPLKMTSGTLLSTPEVGAQEFLTDEYYVTITTGTARRKLGQTLTGSATLDFPSTLAQTDSDLTITVTGAVVGDPCEVAPPVMPPTGSTYTAFVSSADTVTVRFSVYGITAKDPASGTFNVIVHKNR